jgi:hypothetical protein
VLAQAASSDQSRLLGRGPRDPGRLLREEKMRKRVAKEKPRVGNLPLIMGMIPNYRHSLNRIFWRLFVNGRKNKELYSAWMACVS